MTLEERLENWGRVVSSPMCTPGYSNEWSKWYYQIRGLIPDAEDQYRASRPPAGRDERDGWDVERAWRAMSNPVNKDLLCCVYVYRLLMGDLRKHMWERHRSRIRVHTFSFALSNAHREIQRELVRLPPRRIDEKTTCKPGETVL